MTNQTPTDEPRHIKTVEVHAFKRVEQITLEPDMFQLIGGNNANGKTSLLDAIWVALGGGAATRDLSRPIKDGHDTACITLDLGDLKVERKFTAAGTTLTVTDGDGKKVGSPQTVLDRLIGRLGFDPGAFLNMSDKDQRAAILTLVDLPFDLDELEAERRQVFESRTIIGRDVARTKGAFEIADNPGDGPTDETSSADLVAELSAAHAANAEADEWHQTTAAMQDAADKTVGDIASLEQRIADLQAEVEAMRERHAQQVTLLHERRDWGTPERVDIAPIEAALADLEATNRDARLRRERAGLRQAWADAQADFAAKTAELETIDRRKTSALAAATMPVDGLTIGETGLLYRGVPFAQASAAERIRVAFAVGCAANPNIRVACIRDGSLLDDDSLADVAELAAETEFQVFIERVGTGGGVTVVDGMLAE